MKGGSLGRIWGQKRAKCRGGFLELQREALPASSPSLTNGTQAAFLASLTTYARRQQNLQKILSPLPATIRRSLPGETGPQARGMFCRAE